MISEQDRDDIVSRVSSILAKKIDETQGEYDNLPKSDVETRNLAIGRLSALLEVKQAIESGDWI